MTEQCPGVLLALLSLTSCCTCAFSVGPARDAENDSRWQTCEESSDLRRALIAAFLAMRCLERSIRVWVDSDLTRKPRSESSRTFSRDSECRFESHACLRQRALIEQPPDKRHAVRNATGRRKLWQRVFGIGGPVAASL